MIRIILISFLLSLVPLAASAQFLSDGERIGTIALGFITTGVAVGFGITTGNNMQSDPKTVAAFLKQNGTHLRSDLAVGSGKILNDFAKLMAIPAKKIPLFKKEMRKNRKYLRSFCTPKAATEARSRELIAWIDALHLA